VKDPIRSHRSTPARVLERSFYERPVLAVARDMLGHRLVRARPGGVRQAGRIVEVEAYDGPRDLACHASKGRTARTDVMFGEAGHAYVYLVYGMHHCLNVVTGEVGYPSAVLIRGLEPLEGFEPHGEASQRTLARLASGPGRLTRAMGIDLSLNRADLCAGTDLWIEEDEPLPARRVVKDPRIGVDYAGAWAAKPWRLGVADHPSLSARFGRKGRAAGR
jgi:DNA-3-methyladenine glycosylase